MLLKDQEILAKETENMFTGSSADKLRKDASAARYPARSTLHAIPDSSNVSSPSVPVTSVFDEPPSFPVDDSHADPDFISDTADEYSFQDEAEDSASTSYDNSAIADDFNYSNRAIVYQDVLDQPSYVHFFLYPDRAVIKAYLDTQHAKVTGLWHYHDDGVHWELSEYGRCLVNRSEWH